MAINSAKASLMMGSVPTGHIRFSSIEEFNTHNREIAVCDNHVPMAETSCDQPMMVAHYNNHGQCTVCGFPAKCHDY